MPTQPSGSAQPSDVSAQLSDVFAQPSDVSAQLSDVSADPPGFSVHVDPSELERVRLAAAVGASAGPPARRVPGTSARPDRLDGGRPVARRGSGRAPSGRTAVAGGGRSYVFRRS